MPDKNDSLTFSFLDNSTEETHNKPATEKADHQHDSISIQEDLARKEALFLEFIKQISDYQIRASAWSVDADLRYTQHIRYEMRRLGGLDLLVIGCDTHSIIGQYHDPRLCDPENVMIIGFIPGSELNSETKIFMTRKTSEILDFLNKKRGSLTKIKHLPEFKHAFGINDADMATEGALDVAIALTQFLMQKLPTQYHTSKIEQRISKFQTEMHALMELDTKQPSSGTQECASPFPGGNVG